MPQLFRATAASLALVLPIAAQAACTATVHAPGCGPSLNVTFAPNGGGGNQRIDLVATELFPKSWGIMIWGDTPTHWPLSPTCSLHVAFAWGHTFQASATGKYDWSRVWPTSSTPGQYFIQVGSFDLDNAGNWTIVGTEAIRAQCQ